MTSRAELRAFDGPLADDWYRAPLLCAALHAAAIVGDAEFVGRWVDVLRPLQDHVAVAGSGGLVLGPDRPRRGPGGRGPRRPVGGPPVARARPT